MTRWLVIAVVAAGCGGGARTVATGAPAGPGDFPDNPQLAHVPADTPYAFATFKPISPDYWRRMQSMMTPMLARIRAQQAKQVHPLLKAFYDELGGYEPERLERLGIKLTARMVLFGLAAYPVLRLEIASRDRIQAAIERITRRAGIAMPGVAERAGVRYWTFDLGPQIAMLLGLTRDEVVLAVAPRDRLVGQLGPILGEVRPARALTTAWFRDYARRTGFTGQGVGFIDLQRVEALAVGAAPSLAPACRTAIDGLARSVPRIGFGYDDLSRHMISFSIVVELAPELLAVARTLVTKLPGLVRVERVRPIVAFSAAADLERARAFAPPIAARLRDLGERCGESLEEAAAAVEEVGRRPLPPMLHGLHGGVVALTRVERAPDGNPELEGFGLVRVDDTAPLLGLGAAIPDFVVPELDGKATALPPLLKVPGHVAARPDAVAFALGADSARTVEELLAEPPAAAPLVMMQYDYRRFMEAARVFAPSPDDNADALIALGKVFGRATFLVDVDERGLVVSMSIELR